jgi:hypothetical protein
MGIGDWGLGIGDWGLGQIPNPQSPIPNPHLNILNIYFFNFCFIFENNNMKNIFIFYSYIIIINN